MKTLIPSMLLSATVILCSCSGEEDLTQLVETLKTNGSLISIETGNQKVYRFSSIEKEEAFIQSAAKFGVQPIEKRFRQGIAAPGFLDDPSSFTGPTAEWEGCTAEILQQRFDIYRLYRAKTIFPPPQPTDRELVYARVALPSTVSYFERSAAPSGSALEANYPSGVFIEGNGALSSKHQCGSYLWEKRCNWFRCWHSDNYWWSAEVVLTPPPI